MIDGVIRTRVGYAGGLTMNPDYGHIGDHTEAVQIDYDPARVSYADLLEIFWNSHDPAGWQGARQYMRAVFYHDERQQTMALASKKAVEVQTDGAVHTRVVPLHSFTMAEDYHQKYMLQGRIELAREMDRIYPRKRDLVDSTAAARLNGYAGGYGSMEQLGFEIDRLGLGPRGRELLEKMVQDRGLLN
jgi:peptide-methionine (S)-S-oxide reductase